MERETHTEPNQISKIGSPLRDTRSPSAACGACYLGRPTGMALRTNSNFLKRESVPTASDEDRVTKLKRTS